MFAARFLFALLLVAAGCRTARAQPADGYTLALRGVPLQEALRELAQLTQIDLVYTSALVAGKTTYCARRQAAAEHLLACVLNGSGLDYVRSSSGAYLLIPAPEHPARHGYLAGLVTDRATDQPLPHATVYLADAGTGTTTDDAGLFHFGALLPGPHRIVVSYLGYATAVDSVWLAPGTRERLRVTLQPAPLVFEPVLIDGLAQQPPSAALGYSRAGGEALATLQGAATPDVARSAARLLGVSRQQPLADLHIQGGASGEHLTLLDGVPVRNPVSLGRHFGAFSPLALDRLVVRKAGFGAAHGSHLSGVIAASHHLGDADRLAGAASLDPISLNARLGHSGAFSNGSLAVMAAARTSIWNAYREPGLEALLQTWSGIDPLLASRWLGTPVDRTHLQPSRRTPEVRFSDLHLAARLQPGPFRALTASVYRGANHLATTQTIDATGTPETRYDDPLLLQTDDVYDWLNWAAHVQHSWLLGARAVAALRARGSWHASSYGYDAMQTTTRDGYYGETGGRSDERHTVRELALEGTFNYSTAPGILLESGVTLEQARSCFELGNAFVAPFTSRLSAWQAAWYASGRLGLGPATHLEPGLRLTWVAARSRIYAEPRLALRHDRAWQTKGHMAFRIAGGLYRQFINQYELSSVGATTIVPSVLFWLPIDATVAPPKVLHATAEVLLAPGPRWSVGVEGYLKVQPHVLMVDYPALVARAPGTPDAYAEELPQSSFVRSSEGHAYGGSLQARHAGTRLRPSLTYSYSHAVRTYPWPGGERPVPVAWAEPHRLVLDAEAALTSQLTLHTAWTGTWGRRWGLRRFYYDYLLYDDALSFAPFDPARPERHTLPPFYRLDLGLTWTHDGRESTMRVRAFVMNVLDRTNVFDRGLEPHAAAGLRPIDRPLPGRQVALSIQLER